MVPTTVRVQYETVGFSYLDPARLAGPPKQSQQTQLVRLAVAQTCTTNVTWYVAYGCTLEYDAKHAARPRQIVTNKQSGTGHPSHSN
jgi:hypothetical protein